MLKGYIKRNVRMPCKWVSLSIGEPGGDSLYFLRERIVYLGSFLGFRGH